MTETIEGSDLLAEAAMLMKSLRTYGAAEAIFRLRALTELSERMTTTALLNLAAAEPEAEDDVTQETRRAA